MNTNDLTLRPEQMGPAETLLQTILSYTDHMYHGRPGVVRPLQNSYYSHQMPAATAIGVYWQAACTAKVGNETIVFLEQKIGKKKTKTRLGTLAADGKSVMNGNIRAGEYRKPGLFPEVVAWMYSQVAKVYEMNNELVARWASYAFNDPSDHRDLKVVLAAFLLCQSRKGDPVLEDGKIVFHDDDFRSVGEAMCLLYGKNIKDLSPKHLLRIRDVLALPEIAEINRKLGFGKSARKPFLGRWSKTVEKWLAYRESNPKLLDGLVKAAFKSTVKDLARSVGYKPLSPKFFETLRWKQVQAKDGRRTLAIGQALKEAESWVNLSEKEICERIVATKPDYKRIVGLLPKQMLTQAVVACAVENGCMSDKDMGILTPTFEELGLLNNPQFKARWEKAINSSKSQDLRLTNILKNVKNKETQELMQKATEQTLQNVVKESLKNMRVYFCIDISGSMASSLPKAKEIISKFLPAFPLDRLHIAVFESTAQLVRLKSATKAGVENAFIGIRGGGGTDHASVMTIFKAYPPKADEDVLFVWIGDQEEGGGESLAYKIRQHGFNPSAFAMVTVRQSPYAFVRHAAAALSIPFFELDPKTMEDPYALPRTLKQIIEATPAAKQDYPVAYKPKENLLEKILKQPLLQKPVWA